MSEYWKSTPKYWCKHCSVFVRDTKLEKTNHEATPRHQGNLKRFLRDLHRGHEKDQKDKDRAKAEVARLNGVVSGSGTPPAPSIAGPSGTKKDGAYTKPPVPKAYATEAQRKAQLAQLADMGIAIPDELRPDMALAGEWQVTSERVIDEDEEKKPEAIALGVRKRTAADEEEEEQEVKKRRWGTTYKTHPGASEDLDLDALLSNATRKDSGVQKEGSPAVKQEEAGETPLVKAEDDTEISASLVKQDIVKSEPVEAESGIAAEVKQDPEGMSNDASAGVVFKKRKAKNIRQK